MPAQAQVDESTTRITEMRLAALGLRPLSKVATKDEMRLGTCTTNTLKAAQLEGLQLLILAAYTLANLRRATNTDG